MWDAAEDAFRRKSYKTAADIYTTLLQNEKEMKAIPYAEWNLLLSGLALHGLTPEWKNELQTFAVNAPEPLNAKALGLLEFLDSTLYRKVLVKFLNPLPPIKPRLI